MKIARTRNGSKAISLDGSQMAIGNSQNSMSESAGEHSPDNLLSVAKSSDYEKYFEIPEFKPGSELWREAISDLIEQVSSDARGSSISGADRAQLINGLRSVHKMIKPDGNPLDTSNDG